VHSPTHLALALVVSVAFPAVAAAGEWDSRQKDCLAAFADAAKSDDRTLVVCADLFNAEALIDKFSSGEKSNIQKGLRWMYDNGSDSAAKIAREALFRFDVRMPPRAAKRPDKGATAAAPERKRYDPPEAKSAERAECDKLAKEGVKLIKAKKYPQAASTLEKAIAKDGRSEYALYNYACALAKSGKQPKMLETLQNMADLGTDQSGERLIMARSDLDFEDVRDDPEFKRITGYARIQLVNTIGKPGDKGVDNLDKVLVGMGHRKPDQSDDEKALDAPNLIFKPHAKAQVSVIAEVIGNTATRLDPMTFESKYDIIIKWGSKIVDGKAQHEGPANVDEAMAEARKSQNKVLAKPEQAINNVNQVIDTPNRVVSNVEGMKSRVEGTANKIKGVGDKVKGLSEVPGKLEGLTKIKGL
jgi:tetratricopeptide (TPR) repeat protein